MQQMVVVIPVNADVDVTQDVGEKSRSDRHEGLKIRSPWHIHVEHHNRDYHRKYAIAEGFEPAFAHLIPPFRRDLPSLPVPPHRGCPVITNFASAARSLHSTDQRFAAICSDITGGLDGCFDCGDSLRHGARLDGENL